MPIPEDCTDSQAWSDAELAQLRTQLPEFVASEAEGFVLADRLGLPGSWTRDGGFLPNTIVWNGPMTFPVSVESRGLDGGPAPFGVLAFLDGERWPANAMQDAGAVVEPTPGPDGVATFELSIPAPALEGAHDLVLLTVRNRPQNVLASSWIWIVGSTAPLRGANGPGLPVSQVSRTGNGPNIRAADGSYVMKPARFAPDAGSFSWTAHLEEPAADLDQRCPGAVERFRLFAVVDSEPWPFADGEYHLDFDFRVGTAVEGVVDLSGLPNDEGHAVTILLQRNPGRYADRPDGTLSPWFSGVVTEVGSTWW